MVQARNTRVTAAGRDKTREQDLEALRDISDDVIESDFVPYACLLNADTVLTKNGELLQILRITGQQAETAAGASDVRAAIRAAIEAHIPDVTFAIWLHTVRRRQTGPANAGFTDPFCNQLDARWRQQQASALSYVNELTITIVKAGQSAELADWHGFQKSLLPRRDRSRRTTYLEQAQRQLVQVTTRMLEALKPYGARLLTTVERSGVFYGEHLEFLEKLINLQERPMPLPRRDLSYVLTSGDITFGFNAMEVRNAEGTRKFAALMTVKEYKESTLKGIDQFLEIPCEFIITQCFDFIGAARAQESYRKQADYLRISGDKELAGWMEIDRLLHQRRTHGRAFGQQQTSIFLIAPSMKQLEANVRLAQKAFARLGLVAIREDLRIEECYWAQLPGNFPFLTRHHSIDTQHLAGFANLQPPPLGNAAGSPWGPPVAVLKTLQDQPYYFNFQRGNVAHSLLIGRDPAAVSGLAHFLLAQSRRLSVNLWMLDGQGYGSRFFSAMNGHVSVAGTASLKLNPLQLSDNRPNREFLAVWLSTLVDPYAASLSRASLEFFQHLVARVMQLPQDQRRLSNLLTIVRAEDPMLANQLSRWCAGGAYGELFDMPQDQFNPEAVHCWNIAAFAQDDALRIPLASYLLHRLTGALSGRPTLIVLNDALTMLNTPLFSARVPAWLDFLSGNQAACMALTHELNYASAYPYARTLASKAASIFALPDAQAGSEYMLAFEMAEHDVATLARMHPAQHGLLLKRGAESHVLTLDVSAFGELSARLIGQPEAA